MERAERYLNRTTLSGTCMVWVGAINSDGYPRANIKGDGNVKVHRYIFEAYNGFQPEVVRHSCDNPLCINQDHLLPGSILDNLEDRNTRGRTPGHVSKVEIEEVLRLRRSGMSYKGISNKLNINPKRVGYILQRLN